MDSSPHEQRAELKRENPRRSDLIDEGFPVMRALKGQAALRRTISAMVFRSKRVRIRSRGIRGLARDAGDVGGWRACDSGANGLRA
jgi:hypothetical protein